MTGRYPRPGWPHRRRQMTLDAIAIVGSIIVLVATGLHLYELVVALLVGLLVLGIVVWYGTRPTPAQVDAWRRHHGNRWGDRW